MDKVSSIRVDRPKQKVPHHLWELCEQAAEITSTKPGRWLRAGVWALERATIDFIEIKKGGTIKNKAAYFTFLVNKYKK